MCFFLSDSPWLRQNVGDAQFPPASAAVPAWYTLVPDFRRKSFQLKPLSSLFSICHRIIAMEIPGVFASPDADRFCVNKKSAKSTSSASAFKTTLTRNLKARIGVGNSLSRSPKAKPPDNKEASNNRYLLRRYDKVKLVSTLCVR